jgi:hypothetical protein
VWLPDTHTACHVVASPSRRFVVLFSSPRSFDALALAIAAAQTIWGDQTPHGVGDATVMLG